MQHELIPNLAVGVDYIYRKYDRGSQDQQDQDDDSTGEAALPMYGEGAREAREEQGHTNLPTAGRRSR